MEVKQKCNDHSVPNIVGLNNKGNLPASLEASVNEIAQQEGYLTHSIMSRSISTDGGNYLGVLYEVQIKGITKDGERETNIFIKYSLSGENVKILSVSEVYSKEVFFYTELSNVFAELENEADVPLNEMYKVVKSYNVTNVEAIILENVAKKGFGTLYRMDVMPLKFAELSVQQLAKFHALSFVIERQRPDYFDRKIKTLKHPMQFGDTMYQFIKNMYNFSVKHLNSEIRKKTDEIFPTLFPKHMKYMGGEATRTKCLCHGDYRMNNILMRKVEGEVTEVIPVDYQILFYGSPILDFIYFIFGASDRKFRKSNLNDLKDLYFTTLRDFLLYFDIDVKTVYPREEFEKDYEECLDFVLIIGLIIMPFFFTLESEVPDLNKHDILEISVDLDHRFKERVEEVLEDLIEWGKL